MTLDELSIKNSTDKSSLFHNYSVKYDRILCEYRNTYEKVLEIGIHNGGSLKMWKEYFSIATIFGLDILDKKSFEDDRIKILQGDQSDLSTLNKLSNFGPYDLIVDDGSHYYEHQIISFENLFSSLKPGGFYIIEDVCTSYWKDWGFGTKMTAIDFFKNLIDDVNYYGLRLNSPSDSHQSLARREDWLDTNSNQKFQIYSIQFLNSTICIQKKF